jgi:hypothetical protein
MKGPQRKLPSPANRVQFANIQQNRTELSNLQQGTTSGNPLRCWRHLLRNTTHPVLVITDHANLQYYREPHKLGPCVNGYIVELANYHIQLVYKPGAMNRADALSRYLDLVPEEDNELVIVLPDHLFVAPNAPAMKYTATRTKPEDYKSDDTLVESNDEEQGMKAQMAQMGDSKYSAYELDELVMKAQEIDKQMI